MLLPKILAAAVAVPVALIAPASAGAILVDDRRVLYEASEPGGSVAVDSSTYHNDGTLRGGVTRRNGTYRFHPATKDGVFDRIRTPTDPSFNPASESFSYGARIKVRPDATWSHKEMAVVRHGDTDTPGGDYKLELQRLLDGTVDAFCEMHDGDGDGSAYVQADGGLETVADGKWHTITCTRVDQDTVSLTIDGHVASRSTRGNFGSIASKDPLLIGAQYRNDGIRFREQFHGFMDNIHVTVHRMAE